MFVGILHAVGNSRNPLYYLILSTLINIVLDMLLVAVLGFGVGAAALATTFSQGVSAFLCFVHMLRVDAPYRVSLKHIRFHKENLLEIIRYGLPSGIQNSVISLANVFVQTNINSFGKAAMAGCGSYSKIEGFAFLPVSCFTMALSTFVGQNLGKGNEERARKGVSIALLLAVASTVVLMIPVMIFAPQAVWFFNKEPAVIEFGTLFIRWLSPFYVLCCVNQIYAGALRGSGNTTAPMLIMLSSFVFFRQAYLFVMANFISNTIIPISMAYPAGWLLCSTLMFIYFKKAKLSKSRLVKD